MVLSLKLSPNAIIFSLAIPRYSANNFKEEPLSAPRAEISRKKGAENEKYSIELKLFENETEVITANLIKSN